MTEFSLQKPSEHPENQGPRMMYPDRPLFIGAINAITNIGIEVGRKLHLVPPAEIRTPGEMLASDIAKVAKKNPGYHVEPASTPSVNQT